MTCNHGDTFPCGCCEGVNASTPASVENRPGLSALAYRVGTHGRFMQSMQYGISRQEYLRGLTTRNSDDPSIAIMDAWATVLDVLSFYQERIANEGYIRTASERRSILEMARSIGYELRPGVAAGTYLAFKMETAPGAPTSATLGIGTTAQSLPGQDEVPQTFETVEQIEANVEWQDIKARTRIEHHLHFNETHVYLEGVNNNLLAGDALLIIGGEREAVGHKGNENWDFRKIKTTELDREFNLTHVVLERGLGSFRPFVRPAAEPKVYVLRQRAALFGYNAPDWKTMSKEVRLNYCGTTNAKGDPTCTEWPNFSIAGIVNADDATDTVYLDVVYPKIVPGGWVVLSRPGYAEVYLVKESIEDSRTNFALSGKTTRLLLEGENLIDKFDAHVRSTVVFGQSEELELAKKPDESFVQGNTIVLETTINGLFEDQFISITGTDASTGEAVSEVMSLKKSESFEDTTKLTFSQNLQHIYIRDTVVINANVARATHGETKKDEVLGSGDGSQVFQSFQLKNNPLTYVSAVTASGGESTLELRVNGILWDEVSSLYGITGKAHNFVTRRADDGTVTIRFGNGNNGSRLPTGVENITATYRKGIGSEGMVDAGQISLLSKKPLGVKSVTNPLAPTGAADPEVMDDARENAPLTVLTMDRIVSLLDYENFARAYSGVGKAQATLLWSGEKQLVYLTVAGEYGAALPKDSDTYKNLIAAIDAARHVDEKVMIESFQSIVFTFEAKVMVDPVYIVEDVLETVKEHLLDAFAFEARGFGQSVTAGAVIAEIQSVEGVTAVDLEKLNGHNPLLHSRVPALIARWEDGAMLPAQLLTLDPEGITLTQMTS